MRFSSPARPELVRRTVDAKFALVQDGAHKTYLLVRDQATGALSARANTVPVTSRQWILTLLALWVGALVVLGLSPTERMKRFILLGDRATDRHQVDEALIYYGQAEACIPGSDLPEARMGVALDEAGRPDEALPHLIEAERRNPDNPFALFRLAKILLARGDFDGAQKRLSRAERLQPGSLEVIVMMARLERARQRPERARRWARIALEINPFLADAHAILAELDAADGHLQEALEHYTRAVGKNPQWDALMEYGQATLCLRLDQPRAARQALERALGLSWRMSEAHFLLGSMLLAEDPRGARLHLETFLQLAPNSPYAPQAEDWLRQIP